MATIALSGISVRYSYDSGGNTVREAYADATLASVGSDDWEFEYSRNPNETIETEDTTGQTYGGILTGVDGPVFGPGGPDYDAPNIQEFSYAYLTTWDDNGVTRLTYTVEFGYFDSLTGKGTFQMFAIGGDPFPAMSTVADYDAWRATVVSFSEAGTQGTPYDAGMPIDLADAPGAIVTDNDTVVGQDFAELINIGAGNDTVFGNDGNDTINGGSGNDSLNGNIGNDVLDGGEGDDTVVGGQGADMIQGGDGKDNIRGGDDNDTIYGNADDDYIQGGDGADEINGGSGVNKMFGQRGEDTLVGGSDNDTLNGGGGSDFLKGAQGNDWFRAGNGNDTLWGGNGRDTMFGNSDADELLGGGGDDRLNGGGGDDTLRGGTGDDYLKGGAGADTFIFDAGMGADEISAYNRTEDILRIDSNLLTGQTTGQQVMDDFASIVGGNMVLDFGAGNSITFLGFTTFSGFEDDIVIF